MTDPVTIAPLPDGPLQVSGEIELRNSRGDVLTTKEKFWLCRCGGSANKPFCDGTHKKNGFSSARQSDPAQRGTKTYAGKHLTIHDNRSACAHTGYCTKHSPEVFKMNAEPWIDPDGGPRDQTVATVRMCPSGALAASVDGVPQAHGERGPAIHILEHGPYAIVGAPQLTGDAAPVSEEHYTLCRCGQSKNKPFCDGSHWDAGFKDDKN